MGKFKKGPVNKATNFNFKKPGGTCSTSILTIFVPPILKTIILALVGKRITTISFDDFAEPVQEFTNAVAEGEEAVFKTTPSGRSVDTTLSDVAWDGEQLRAAMALQIDGQAAFSGNFELLQVDRSNRFMLGEMLIDAIEMHYYHLWQRAEMGIQDSTMDVGSVRISGVMSAPEAISELFSGLLRRNEPGGDPDFDTNSPYGLFPVAGFHHFYGGLYRRVG